MIISDGARSVHARGGNDTICLTGSVGAGTVLVDAGPGTDVILNRLSGRSATQVRLGAGADRYVGGDRRDYVLTGADIERDRVWTGPGQDQVVARGEDDVDLGAGPDEVDLAATSAEQRLVGGAGADALRFGSGADAAGWQVDNTTQRATRDGATMLRWTSFTQFRFPRQDLASFTGGPADDVVEARSIGTAVTGAGDDAVIAGGVGSVDVGAGNDRVIASRVRDRLVLGAGDDRLELSVEPNGGLPIYDGGPGLDLFSPRIDVPPSTTFPQEIRGDLVTQDITFPGSDVPAIKLAAIEGLHLYGFRVTLVGDQQRNHLAADGCHITITGAEGDDLLHTALDPFQDFPCDEQTAPTREMRGGAGDDVLRGDIYRDVLFGGSGNDLLRGGEFNDTLVGGPGRDEARGESGRDTCRAEVRRGCEK
ncbi:calcium-binding protein [Nocardioides psychrotolerans]|uniref:calcium-binding protein n=1 Tax=Nocardioides psychrotolerans TaxID=1005945 RepID=UPI0014793E62|nr:calcium-binding protein [Nocardioides psychrotolerans]